MKRWFVITTLVVSHSVLFAVTGRCDEVKSDSEKTPIPDVKYDLVVYGATPGGVACAVRAAREGLDVLLVNHAPHLGGIFTSGLSTMDTLYNGARSPLYDELRHSIYDHYRTTYGEDSEQYKNSQPGHPKTHFEARVIERLVNEMLAREPRIRVVKEFYPVAVKKNQQQLQWVTFQHMRRDERFVARGLMFADCSYEADLAAVAGVPYRVGRESRDEFDEPHAGIMYMRRVPWPPQNVDQKYLAEYRRLNLFHYDRWDEVILPQSTGAADPAVQAFNMRTVLTNDPANRILPEKPAGYDPDVVRNTFDVGRYKPPTGFTVPNRKFCWNHPELVGAQDAYVEGDWPTRRRVAEEHRDATLSLLYYYQNDPRVPKEVRDAWRELGLPQDEFAENGHMPYEVYVRETRRIVGRAVFTEHDARLAADLKRAPVHADSISITEWFMDSHACTAKRVGDSHEEGTVQLKNLTFPGQVPYRTILAKNIDNLLVPVCLSCTHVAWGTIRLEPTWMSLGEAAAYAAIIAKSQQIPPCEIDSNQLVRLLTEKRFLLSFFNDVEQHAAAAWYPAAQYLGTRGFFGSYDARPLEPLTAPTADAWCDVAADWSQGRKSDPTIQARKVWEAEQKEGTPITAKDFMERMDKAFASTGRPSETLQPLLKELEIPATAPVTRGDACRLIDAVLRKTSPNNSD